MSDTCLRQTLLPAAGAAVAADTTQALCVSVATNLGISRLCPSSSLQLCFSIALGQVWGTCLWSQGQNRVLEGMRRLLGGKGPGGVKDR